MRQTCGPLFRMALQRANNTGEGDLHYFSTGHMVGQAEKIVMGVCSAAMFRPHASERIDFERRLTGVCMTYNLRYLTLSTSLGAEYWLCEDGNFKYVELLRECAENSPQWHFIRGVLCGIPVDKIDLQFHFRYAPA